jgi:DNA-binding CsgD family transcriptional regulator
MLDETLSRIIGGIYDAALDSALWPDVLASVTEFVGGSAAGLSSRDSVKGTGAVYYGYGADLSFATLYFDKYMAMDPLNASYALTKIGEVFSNGQVVPHAEFIRSRFYKEWVQPQGWIDNVCVMLERSAESQAGLVVFRHERDGLADEPARHRMRLVAPHVRRAVLIGKVIDFKTCEGATFADALDGFHAAIFFVDASGRIVHANAAGHLMLALREVFCEAGGRLVATNPQTDQALRTIFIDAGNGDSALGTKGIALPLTGRGHDGEHYAAHLLPLMSGARRRAGADYAAVAALFVHKAALAVPHPLESIATRYHLTPTELRILLAIVEVGGVPEVAEALGIRQGTVKTHLRHLYEKLGAHRQADLVKLVAGYSSPLLG